MKKEIIYTKKAPEPGHYSQAIRAAGLLFVSGQTAEDPDTNRPVHGPVKDQTRIIMNNIKTMLEEAGSGLSKVVRADIYLSSMDIKDEFSASYIEYFSSGLPARNAVCTAGIDDGLDVEIEVIALA